MGIHRAAAFEDSEVQMYDVSCEPAEAGTADELSPGHLVAELDRARREVTIQGAKVGSMSHKSADAAPILDRSSRSVEVDHSGTIEDSDHLPGSGGEDRISAGDSIVDAAVGYGTRGPRVDAVDRAVVREDRGTCRCCAAGNETGDSHAEDQDTMFL